MFVFFAALFVPFPEILSQSLPSCASKVYCQGPLLDTVQMARLFNDSKTFVDMKLMNSENTTLSKFAEFQTQFPSPTKDQIRTFVSENFENFDEFEDWDPPDYTSSPKFLERVTEPKFREFAQNLVKIWPILARKIKPEIKQNPGLYSLIPVDNGFIVPGGRFREFYYWDSYWIVKGLLISEMHDTVRGMLENFVTLIKDYGFIPNGARIYYLNRSQPPLFTMMVYEYIKATNNVTWLRANLHFVMQELDFWLEKHVVKVQKNGISYDLARYDVESGSPRPESYAEDVTTAGNLAKAAQTQLYADLKSGAESGWDFSGRWIVDNQGGNNANLTYLHTRDIIPVDLNSFLAQAFLKVFEFCVKTGNTTLGSYWLEKHVTWVANIHAVFYDHKDGIWYDYNAKLQTLRKYFYPSNFAPLWAQAFDLVNAERLGGRAADYLIKNGIMDYMGGIPASVSQTGEQWDYPNAWPPLQALVILGLDRSGNCKAKNISAQLAERWINANLIGFNQSGEMYEKYDAEYPGQYGGGGEYKVQSGFGWTNGVVLEFIQRFFTKN